ncbi:unnamed protein product [Soboliphyme baturini]|uniref:CUB_2 domain-containing protein n=1 Tax=Soboliphyme baturini TaxID=241478 RepID=A0A183J036_9BILA|nr:unnamed protein product [Soboliphyme baturini]
MFPFQVSSAYKYQSKFPQDELSNPNDKLTISILLITFDNPKGTLNNGDHCSNVLGQLRPCNIGMTIKFTPLPYQPGTGVVKRLEQLTTASNMVNFSPEKLYGEWHNPQAFAYNGTWQGFVLSMSAYDIYESLISTSLLPIYNVDVFIEGSELEKNITIMSERNNDAGPVRFSFSYKLLHAKSKHSFATLFTDSSVCQVLRSGLAPTD